VCPDRARGLRRRANIVCRKFGFGHIRHEPGAGSSGNAQFAGIDVCSLLSASQVAVLLGQPVSGSGVPGVNANGSPGATLRWCDYSGKSLEVDIVTSGGAYTPVQWAHQQAGNFPRAGALEQSVGSYAAFSADLGQTVAAKGWPGVEISYPTGLPAAVPKANLETREATDIEAIWQKVGL
jgi:hypothetical protein